MAEPWVERYRPRRLHQVAGHPQAVETLRRWAEAWKRGTPKERAVLLAGPPGCGKTSVAHALGAEFGWEVIELNASDARSAPAIHRIAGLGSVHQTFAATGEYHSTKEGRRKLIILDEADNLYERGAEGDDSRGEDLTDRGGKRAIVETVAQTKQPIVLIANDAYALTRGTGERLARACLRVPFRRLPAPTVKKVLRDVAHAEGIVVADDVLQVLAQRAEGDLRSALNDLEAVAAGRGRIDVVPGLELGQRNRTESAFDAVGTVFRSTEIGPAVEAARALDEPPDFLLAWVDENLPGAYRNPRDLALAYDRLSRADVFLGRTMRRQHFGLWGFATELVAGGVAMAKSQRYVAASNYRFPGWILHMGATKGARGVRARVGAKLGAHLHLSRNAVVREVLPLLRLALVRDQDLAESVGLRCDLDEDEVRFLLGPSAPAAYADDVVHHIEKRRKERDLAQAHFSAHRDEEAREAEPPAKASRHRPTRLGDF